MSQNLKIKILSVSVDILWAWETIAFFLALFLSPLTVTALIRTGQIVFMTGFLAFTPGGLTFAGLAKSRLTPGLKTGVAWSIGMGLAAAGTGLMLHANHIDPFELMQVHIPSHSPALFIFTAGVLGPIAEELCFRGILYTVLRRFGFVPAMAFTTTLFTLFHASGSLPLIPLVGGLVFAASFEHSKSLVTPLVIHISGNFALFLIT